MEEFDRLVEIIATLRGENGCPWDKKQTHQSLLPFLFEESNEVADTIISKDYNHLQEELGDLLLQIVLHSQIAKENNQFSISDVITSISEKMIRRHPHIFGNVKVQSEDELHDLWEKIKKQEHESTCEVSIPNFHSVLDKIPQNVTAMPKAEKIQKEAIKSGFDWPKNDFNSVIGKVKEEISEIEEAIQNINFEPVQNISFEQIEAEVGDLLFATIHLAYHLDVDAETALFKCNDRFSKRFRLVEIQAKNKNKELKDFTIDELHQFWRNAKVLLSQLSFEDAVKKLREETGAYNGKTSCN